MQNNWKIMPAYRLNGSIRRGVKQVSASLLIGARIRPKSQACILVQPSSVHTHVLQGKSNQRGKGTSQVHPLNVEIKKKEKKRVAIIPVWTLDRMRVGKPSQLRPGLYCRNCTLLACFPLEPVSVGKRPLRLQAGFC